jgi:hypothetical protein
VAFDASGNVRWSVPGYTPQIATADGGFIAEDPNTGAAVIFDRNGSVGAQIAGLPTYSWKGAYQVGSVESVLPVFDLGFLAQTHAAVPKGNLTGNGFSLVHPTFGLVFCGPAGTYYGSDGQCFPPGLSQAGTPVQFSYLPVSQLSDQTYTNAVDFSQAQNAWVDTIKSQAYNQFRAAFVHLPAIVARNQQPSPLYGRFISPKAPTISFDRTTYITGFWPGSGANAATGYTPLSGCNTDGICPFSWVYYLPIMGNSQQALAYILGGGSESSPVSPQYPPTDATSRAQFLQVVNSIGYAIGTTAAHETGHQLALPYMDCDLPGHASCPEEFIYQNGGGGSNHEWFYGAVNGEKIHWSQSAVCAIERYLLGTASAPCK